MLIFLDINLDCKSVYTGSIPVLASKFLREFDDDAPAPVARPVHYSAALFVASSIAASSPRVTGFNGGRMR